MTRRRGYVSLVAAAAALSLVSACSSSGGNSASGATTGNSAVSGSPIKVGVLMSLSGSAASGFTGVEDGVKARLAVANAAGGVDGHKITYVMGDDTSSPQGNLAAVNRLIQQEHVTAIIEVSSFFFGGYKAAVTAGVPVFGTGFDGGPEWLDKSNKNLFDVNGVGDYTKVPTTFGKIAKALGITKMGGLSYSSSPSAQLSVHEWVESAKQAGVAAGYQKAVPFGSTDTGPVVLGVKNSATDGFYMSTIPNTAFSVASGLSQQGAKLKGVFLATGYGGDLLSDKAATQAAQGLYFLTSSAPVELKTEGTMKMQDGLHKYASQSADVVPSFSQTEGWLATDALVWGLGNAGKDLSAKNIVSSSRDATWDAAGLTKPVDFSSYGEIAGGGVGPGNCLYVVQLEGSGFKPVPQLSPVCGDLIPGLTVEP